MVRLNGYLSAALVVGFVKPQWPWGVTVASYNLAKCMAFAPNRQWMQQWLGVTITPNSANRQSKSSDHLICGCWAGQPGCGFASVITSLCNFKPVIQWVYKYCGSISQWYPQVWEFFWQKAVSLLFPLCQMWLFLKSKGIACSGQQCCLIINAKWKIIPNRVQNV